MWTLAPRSKPNVAPVEVFVSEFLLEFATTNGASPGLRLRLHATLETPISFTLMVHHIVLYKLKPEVTPARVEEMMMNARMQLLKIPEVLSIKCGKRIDPEMRLAILHRHRF